MAQIHGPELGAPAVNVTSGGEIVTTGSIQLSQQGLDESLVTSRENTQLLSDILKEIKRINMHMMSITGINFRGTESD